MASKKTFEAFLSIPYGSDAKAKTYWAALASAIKESAKLSADLSLEVFTADETVSALTLKDSVEALIDRCDFTIAVVSEKNANVFWEIGYTEAQGKPVVYLVDGDDPTSVAESPVLIVEALKCEYKGSEVQEAMRNNELPEATALRLRKFVEQATEAVLAKPRPPNFQVFANREDCDLPGLVARARERIHLITTNLSYFADTERFVVKGEDGEDQYAFDVAVRSGVDIQVRLMDPESPSVQPRAEQLGFGHDVGSYREELLQSAVQFYHRFQSHDNVDIRVYADLPLQITLLADSVIVTSIISRGSRSRRNVHFMLDTNIAGAGESFERHFTEVTAAVARHIREFPWAAPSPKET